MIAERPTREEVEEIVDHSREEIRNAATEAINSVVEASKKSITELQQAGIDGVQQVADSVGGIPEKLDSLSEKVNRLLGAYDLGKWIAAIVLGGWDTEFTISQTNSLTSSRYSENWRMVSSIRLSNERGKRTG